MLIRRIYDNDLSQTSYFIGCQALGEAIVVDPRRDVAEYIKIAEENGMTIRAVTETHIHADYLSGTRELAAKTGATMYVSDEGGADWTYGDAFDDAVRMKDGHSITLGNITIQAVHTPGHTPEHLSFLVTDGAQADSPGFMLTGDFVFVGDVGRPDLLDEAAGGVDTRFQGAKDLFASLRDRFLTLPDYVQVLPGHGAGSACGKALGAVPTSTIGYERVFSWWAQFVVSDDEQGFIAELLSGQPDAHAYFSRMKMQNKQGPALLGDQPELKRYTPAELQDVLDRDEVIFIDTRHSSDVHTGTVPRSINIPGAAKAASYSAWVYDPDREHRPIVLLSKDIIEATEFRDHVIRVGIDTVVGYLPSLKGMTLTSPAVVSPEELPDMDHALLLDVRSKAEFSQGCVPGAVHVSGGKVIWELSQLPSDGTIVSYCQSGVRNSILASALRRHGYGVVELKGSYQAWVELSDSTPHRTTLQ